MNTPFSAWREGAPFYAPPLVLGLLLTWAGWPGALGLLGAVILVVGLAVLAFFRDPARTVPGDPDAIVAPADGQVVAVEDLPASPHFDGPCKRVSIFLSLLNVHVNRAPAEARVVGALHQPGGYLNAMDPASSERNESNTLRLETPHGPMTVRQIAGLVARRIVCVVEPGTQLAPGERFGMIRFGSRTELYVAPTAKIAVTVGQRVQGGLTIVARAPRTPGNGAR